MKNDDSFESTLRRMIPASADHFAEETFYQAGWAAAQQSRTAVSERPRERLWTHRNLRQSAPSFSAGLVCGLLACLVFVFRDADNMSAQTTAAAGREKTSVTPNSEVESTRLPSAELLENGPRRSSDAIARSTEASLSLPRWIMPWTEDSKPELPLETGEMEEALSLGARRSWYQVSLKDDVSEGTGASSSSDARPLRAAPWRADVDELL